MHTKIYVLAFFGVGDVIYFLGDIRNLTIMLAPFIDLCPCNFGGWGGVIYFLGDVRNLTIMLAPFIEDHLEFCQYTKLIRLT